LASLAWWVSVQSRMCWHVPWVCGMM
jgi:hypothetical protein